MSLRARPYFLSVDRGLALLLLVNLGLLLYYLLVDFQYLLHADASIRSLLAQEIHDTGKYFPPAWNYVNGDLWVFYTHSFIVPLLGLFPNGYGLFAVSGIASTALVLGGTWLAGDVLGQSRRARLVNLLVLTSGISLFMAENVFGQAAYGSMYYMACFLVYFSWRFLQAAAGRRWRWGLGVALVTALVFWANPQRAAATYAVPLMAAGLAWWLAARRESERSTPALGLALLFVAAAGAGSALHAMVLAGVNHSVGLSEARWLPFNEIVRNVLGLVEALLVLLGGLPQKGVPIASPDGVYQALRLLAALALFGLMPWAVARLLAGRRRGQVFFGAFALASTFICVFIYATTTVPDMTSIDATSRYLVPSVLCMLLALASVAVDENAVRPLLRGASLAALAVLATSSTVALRVPESPGLPRSLALEQENPRIRLARFLEQNGLRYGYADFWHSGAVNVLSAQRVRIHPIQWAQGLPVPMPHLSSDRWYRPAAWSGPTFLLFRGDEDRAADRAALEALLGKPLRTLTFEGYSIVVYGENIASRLPAWSIVALERRIPIDANSRHLAGRFQPEPPALVAERGEAGFLHFGPFLHLRGGRYTASFTVDASAGGAVPGSVDVSARGGSRVFATRPIAAGAHRIAVPFILAGDESSVELRVVSSGAGRLRLDAIELAREE